VKPQVTFSSACEILETILGGGARAGILAGQRLSTLRDAIQSHSFSGVSFERIVRRLDARTRDDGFHVLHDWDGKADKFNEETIPAEVARYAAERCGADASANIPAILLDYYFLYLLALLALRAWDEGDASENLDRVNRLLGDLQGRSGSGHRFVDDA
jgi:hypothetical protein